jgi:hypothetical protein
VLLSRLCLVIDIRVRVVGLLSPSSLSQIAVEVEGTDGGGELGLEALAFFEGRLFFFGELFEVGFLLVGFGDVAGDELAGFGGFGEGFESRSASNVWHYLQSQARGYSCEQESSF